MAIKEEDILGEIINTNTPKAKKPIEETNEAYNIEAEIIKIYLKPHSKEKQAKILKSFNHTLLNYNKENLTTSFEEDIALLKIIIRNNENKGNKYGI